jgi:hypothetical protein
MLSNLNYMYLETKKAGCLVDIKYDFGKFTMFITEHDSSSLS